MPRNTVANLQRKFQLASSVRKNNQNLFIRWMQVLQFRISIDRKVTLIVQTAKTSSRKIRNFKCKQTSNFYPNVKWLSSHCKLAIPVL